MARKTAGAGQLGPASRDKKARMRAMTAAAVELFSEEGYSAVSTRRIAERAGCSETLLFRYFGDKRGLLMAICNDLRDDDHANARRPLDASEDVHEFIERYLLESFEHLKRQAPELKVVIAALINDPEMTADFSQKHDEAVDYVAGVLGRFQQSGAIASSVDVSSIASAIEQLSFAVGFLLQLVFERPESELTAIANSSALILSHGLQAGAPQPLLEPRSRKAVVAVLDARQRLDSVIELLEDGEPVAANGSEPRRGKPRTTAPART
ncbi:MAG: TetR/AcrR family transcriptional regulator [Acidimicrobiia bacterium]